MRRAAWFLAALSVGAGLYAARRALPERGRAGGVEPAAAGAEPVGSDARPAVVAPPPEVAAAGDGGAPREPERDRVGGDAPSREDLGLPADADFEGRFEGRTRGELEVTYERLQSQVQRDRRRLFDERFEAGHYVVHRDAEGLLPSPPRGPGGLDVEMSWRAARDADGSRVLHVVTLPPAEYPEYYAAQLELRWLRERLRPDADGGADG